MLIEYSQLWDSLIRPLCRLLIGMAAGLFLANVLESLNWADYFAKLAKPLAKAARLNPLTASSFALAALSPAAANAFLAEKHDEGLLSTRDLVLANLFNSLPANLLHLPTIFFLTWPILGSAAIIYVGISFLAALGRTIFTIYLGRMLPNQNFSYESRPEVTKIQEKFWPRFKKGIGVAWRRFQKRLPRLFYYTIPFYVIIYIMNQTGLFGVMEKWLSENLSWLAFIKPQAMSIIILQIVAEMGASLGAAGALLESGGLSAHDIVLAMLAGNILSTPMCAIRHQFPAYAGFYKPVLALKLVLINQTTRAFSMVVALLLYAYF